MYKILALYRKHREVILYVFFGGCTTLSNIIIYWACTRFFGMGVTLATIIAWVISVLFAYVTNRIWVFQSKEKEPSGILLEMASFFGARLATGMLDLGIMYLFVDILHRDDMIVKIASNVVVIVLNYFLSKLFIFKEGNKKR